jgi:hypothetical protein
MMLMPLIPSIRISNPFIAWTTPVAVTHLPTMAEIGLNLFQILQSELLSRETSCGNLGLGSRFASVMERQTNASAVSYNSQIWRPSHALAPVSALTRERTVHKRKEEQTENAKTSYDLDAKI